MSRLQAYQSRLMPLEQKKHAYYLRTRKEFEDHMAEKLGHFYVPVGPGPVGDREIVKRTAIQKEEDIDDRASAENYFASGYSLLLQWLRLAEKFGLNLRTVASVFEFGTGSARLIRHLRCMDGVDLVASDVIPEFIDWCRQNVPGVEFYTNEFEPPLAFAADNSFDFAFAQSVFTHIPLNVQSAWVAEIYRVLRPGGLFIGTVLGNPHEEIMLTPQQRAHIRENRDLVLDASSAQASYSTQLIESWDVFQKRSEVLRVFGADFEVLDYVPAGLDTLVLRKPQLTRHL